MPVWEIDAGTYQQNRGGPGELGEADEPPSIKVEGAPQRTVAAGAALTLDAFVVDDGRRRNRPSQSGSNARVEGPLSQAMVRLDRGVRLGVDLGGLSRRRERTSRSNPRKVAGRPTARPRRRSASARPGTYVLRAYADDGILVAAKDVTVTVSAAVGAKAVPVPEQSLFLGPSSKAALASLRGYAMCAPVVST